MPDRISDTWSHLTHATLFAGIGIVLAVGQHLKSREPWVWTVVIGRSICTAGVAMSAGAVLVWVPELSILGQIGVAAALASLGTAGLERLLGRVLEGRAQP